MASANIEINRTTQRMILDLQSGKMEAVGRNSPLQLMSADTSPRLDWLRSSELQWLDIRSDDLICKPGEHLIVCTNPYLEYWPNIQLVHELYSKHGFKFVGLWPTVDVSDVEQLRPSSMPIILDDEYWQLSQKFDTMKTQGSWPLFVMFDSQGQAVSQGSSLRKLIHVLRAKYFEMLESE